MLNSLLLFPLVLLIEKHAHLDDYLREAEDILHQSQFTGAFVLDEVAWQINHKDECGFEVIARVLASVT